MRVRIETDLSWAGTHVYDADTSAELRNVDHLALFGSGGLGERLICRLELYQGAEEFWHWSNTRSEDVNLVGFALTGHVAAEEGTDGGV
jgi:hypothetical protein